MTARAARESLAKGLRALQSDSSVPAHLVQLAEPIAQAMGALHQIERSGGAQIQPQADLALNSTRTALAQLQAAPPQHPAVAAAMEAVAASLGSVHALSKMGAGQPAQAAPFFAQATVPAGQPAVVPQGGAPGGFPEPVRQAFKDPFKEGSRPPPPGAALAATFVAQGPSPAAYGQPASVQGPGAAPHGSSKHPPSAPMPTGEVHLVNADLGTHSPTNFYKGLSGNDVIDHGGLFVSTYVIPKIGTPVRLKVSLPGGYEFEANAVVRWCREQSEGSDAPPGFGAQFTQITTEARQLVYRYVRNREPLFHDDM